MGVSEKIANAESSDWLREDMTDEEVSKIISEAKEAARERIKLINPNCGADMRGDTDEND